jgi:glycosyltransferase involved in cell wall biosynthesis
MRIGVDIKAFKNGSTGIARYLRSMLDELQQLDSENEYFLFEPRALGYVTHNPRWRTVTIPWKLPGIIWLQTVLPRYIRKLGIDLFWAPEEICPIALPRRLPVVTTIYDLTHIRFPETLQTTNLLIKRLFERMTLKRSNAIVTISDFIGREIVQVFSDIVSADKVHAIPCGGPGWSPPPDYDAERRGNHLFFAGNFEPRKNLLNLIKALEILHARGLSIPLILAGPRGWKNRPILDHLEQSPIKDNLTIMGYISEEQLKEQYLTCKALVYPSVYEGFGLPVLEALSLDCLVITAKGTPMEEVGGKHVLLCDPHDPEDIARAIAQVCDSSFDRSVILGERESVLQAYAWRGAAERLLGVFCQYGYKQASIRDI